MVEQRTIDLSAIKDPAAVEIIKFLLEENRLLRERVRLLEAEVARLKKNSSTSSKPPSSDITKPADQRRQSGERKIGAQPRHPAKNRALFSAEELDESKVLDMKECPDCGNKVAIKADADVLIQQTVELPEKPVQIIEHQRPGYWCDKCKKLHYAELPLGVIEGQLCGPRLQSLIAYLKGGMGVSYTELSQFCSDVLGFKASRGMLCDVIHRVTQALEKPCQELEAQISKENMLNIDESGWYDSGARYWIWLFCTNMIAFFSIQSSRGCKVLKEILGETFSGAIISDFYSVYVSYASLRQQFCLAHLIRDIKFLTTLPDPVTKEFGHQILRCFKLFFQYWHLKDKVPREVFLRRCKKIKRRLYMLLIHASLPKGEALTMKKRLIKHWDSLFRFIDHPDLYQPTNNLAEQTMRCVVRIRRQTQGSRSAWGRLWAGRIMSVFATCRKQNRSAWHFILDTINAKNFSANYPSLLPT
jgi:transposase